VPLLDPVHTLAARREILRKATCAGVSLIFFGAMVGCTSAFPDQKEATNFFLQHQEDFQRLLRLRAESGLETVVHRSSVDKLIGYSFDGSQRELNGDLKGHWVSLLEDLRIHRVTYLTESAATAIVPAGHAVAADPRLFVEYLHQHGAGDARGCEKSQLEEKAGTCVIPLVPDWWLHYSWVE
jgi:hypothetical protein